MVMSISPSRALRFVLTGLCMAGLVTTTSAQQVAAPVAAAPQPAPVPWLYKNSDIPIDRSWTFGELDNGLRYAVRRNGVPPEQVSIRIAIDAGALHERDSELGFAHYNEHLSFGGSKYVGTGEAKKVWQRLGASFGSDTNAATTSTQTIYKLDLPSATDAGLDETMKILSGMMADATLSQAEVDAERRTVLAELRDGDGPEGRIMDARLALMFGGQLLGKRPTIGTIQTLNAATPASLRAFRDRWYRPSRTVISISGDVEPTKMVGLIKKWFSSWKGVGPETPDVDFGKPDPAQPKTRFLVEPGAPTVVSLAWLRPWELKNDTIVLNQGRLLDLLAQQIINRRLETAARAGGSFVSASLDQNDLARSTNGTFVNIIPIGNDWQAALADVRAVLADAMITPPTQAEIDRETSEIVSAFDNGVENASVEASSKQADDVIEAVNIRETIASPTVARDVFTALKGKVKPADILAASKRMFTGVGPRALVTSKVAMADGGQKLSAALAQPPKALAAASQKDVTFDQLPKLGKPGTVVSESTISGAETTILRLSNGVTAMLSSSPAESGRIFVQSRFGYGRQSVPKTGNTPLWAANRALVASGIGTLNQNDIDRMLTGKKISLEFETGDDAFTLRGNTRPVDLANQLKVMAAKFAAPGWDAAPVNRAKAAFAIESSSWDASPQGVLNRDLEALLRSGDRRWASPTPAEAEALTPQQFRAFWEPRLTSGPLEISIFGDFNMAEAHKALLETFGALPPRKPIAKVPAGNISAGPMPTAKPIVRYHKGNPEQAAAIVAWSTGGGVVNSFESRVLDVLAQIYGDRMFELFREADGQAYSPSVFSSWPTGMNAGGSFVALSQIKPDGVAKFYERTKSIAADLAAKPVTEDELKRAIGPMREQLARAASGKWFWMNQLAGASTDPQRVTALKSWPSDLTKITPALVQAAAQKYLTPGKAFSMIILPAKK